MKPRNIGKAFSFWIAGILAVVALAAPAASVSAQATGTVTAYVRYCTGLSYQGLMGDVGPDCVAGPASFEFYLHGDGTDDSWTLAVGDSGEGSMVLQAGTYDVWTPGGPIFNVTVPADGAASFVYGFPSAAPAPAPDPDPDPAPAPVVETATLNVNTYACTGVASGAIVLYDIGPDCTRIAANLDFYLWGDGTDDHWNLSTSAAGPVSIVLPVGDYEVLNTSSWAGVGATVPSGGGTLSIGYAAPAAPPPPAPAPEPGVVNVSVFHCTGLQSPGILNEVGSDCVAGPAVFDFYLIGDGTDDSWRLNVGDSGSGSLELAAGEYEVYEVSTDTRVPNVVIPSGGSDSFVFGIPRTVAPPTQTGTLTVNTYVCTGVTGGAIVLNEIGPDCTRVAADLDFYLWGDGTDQSWRVTTNAAGPVDAELPVGDYLVIENPSWLRVDATVTESGGTLNIGFPASYSQSGMMVTP